MIKKKAHRKIPMGHPFPNLHYYQTKILLGNFLTNKGCVKCPSV